MANSRDFTKESYESFSSVDVSYKKMIPPWCSSRKVYDRRKPKRIVSKREILSTYPRRINIWEYLYENNNENFNYNERITKETEMKENKSIKKRILLLLILLIASAVVVSLLMSSEIPRGDVITKVIIARDKFMTLLGVVVETKVDKCCQRIIDLTSKLSRIECAIRYKFRRQKPTTTLPNTFSIIKNNNIKRPYIQGVTAIKGNDTEEWGGRVALWGIVPLWRAAPPINTIFALRKTTPTDCWSFSGSRGEVILNLPNAQSVTYVSVEHIRPDTAKSAPKNFIIYGILFNDTWVKLIQDEYETRGTAKQFYPIKIKILFKSIVFRILTNQGNRLYTCLYRLHIYGNVGTNTL